MASVGMERVSPLLMSAALRSLMATVWISSGIFAIYILARYWPGLATGELALWNSNIQPHLYQAEHPVAVAGLGLHLFTGALLLLLGSIQFLNPVRARWPGFHRATGRVYILACVLMALGGMVSILARGTVGGMPMNVAFMGYGLALLLCAVMAVRHAMARSLTRHRAWAIRLYALVIGSWLYRMYYGLIFGTGVGLSGIQLNFQGPLDLVLNYLFWVPNLVVAELVIRGQRRQAPAWLRAMAAALIAATATLIAGATYFAARDFWLPVTLALLRSG